MLEHVVAPQGCWQYTHGGMPACAWRSTGLHHMPLIYLERSTTQQQPIKRQAVAGLCSTAQLQHRTDWAAWLHLAAGHCVARCDSCMVRRYEALKAAPDVLQPQTEATQGRSVGASPASADVTTAASASCPNANTACLSVCWVCQQGAGWPVYRGTSVSSPGQ